MPSVDGKFTADHFEGTATTTTYLTGPGDYALTRTVTAKRVGDCPPAAPGQILNRGEHEHDRLCDDWDRRP